jgi:hypothetical protein
VKAAVSEFADDFGYDLDEEGQPLDEAPAPAPAPAPASAPPEPGAQAQDAERETEAVPA